ncbi:uncharacterized protein IUM83_11802 [Phytophthora cinnamomi]|uniref:uncharacterized protein n=1 Tax=Phytophthora cinnamomi TaxID=4785 RepID=UPI00355949C6|nr:hypothetical protein IUM83_11802 [Phytophthora cinnamomi]
MDYAMDFKAIWLLFRKEKWTWKAATEIQTQYGLRGRNLRGGKQGEDYVNCEGELLVYGRSDKELCARLNIANVMVRSDHYAIRGTATVEAPARPKSPSPAAKAPNKKTKKPLREKAMQRRRELTAFDKIWDRHNSTETPIRWKSGRVIIDYSSTPDFIFHLWWRSGS